MSANARESRDAQAAERTAAGAGAATTVADRWSRLAPTPIPPELSQVRLVPWRAALGRDESVGAWLTYAALRAAMAGITRLPLPVQDAFIEGLARLGHALDRRHSRAAREFVRSALGPATSAERVDELVLGAWRHLLQVSFALGRGDRIDEPQHIARHADFEACADVARARARGGCIIAMPHVGDWEIGATTLAWFGFDPCHAVARPPKNRPLSLWLQRARERRGVRILGRTGAMDEVQTVLRAGGHVVMLLDQRARHKPIVAPFLGRLALCERAAPALVRRSGAPIVFAACYRLPERGRFRFVLPKVLWPEDLAGLSPTEVMGRINRELEQLILAAPEQYFWLHDRYRGAPEGAGAGAASG
jgi:lauroyl/myristoyl acyltransferase